MTPPPFLSLFSGLFMESRATTCRANDGRNEGTNERGGIIDVVVAAAVVAAAVVV